MGIEHLTLSFIETSDETWRRLCRSLLTHPRINVLSLHYGLSAESKTIRMNAILQMLQQNTVVHTITLPDAFNNEAVYRNSILPRLETNRSCFEVKSQAVKRADPSSRPQLLGRALHVVQYTPDRIFRFLFENVPTFVGTEEVEDSAIPLQSEPAVASGQKRKAP